MIFIGIVIFTVSVQTQELEGHCAAGSPASVCEDYVTLVPHWYERQEPRYLGEFKDIGTCLKAGKSAVYSPKKGERVDDFNEVLCVPKQPAEPSK